MPMLPPPLRSAALASLVALTSLLVPTAGWGQACGAPDPTDLSDARLPAGYQASRWGMSGAAVQALRGYALERYPDPMHPEVYQLHETILDEGSPTITIRYTFYKDRLMEVTQYLRPDFIELAESNLLTPYTEQYGPFAHKETRRGPKDHGERINREILERRWTWCDRFTEVVLARQLEFTEVVLRRNSRLILDELRHDAEHQREVDAWKRLRELPTD